MKKVVIAVLTLYQKVLSPDTGSIPRFLGLSKPTCIYHPSCSEYMKIAVGRFGVLRGIHLGFVRLGRCTPSHTPGVDLVPKK